MKNDLGLTADECVSRPTELIEMPYRWDLDKGCWEYWFQGAWVSYEELGE